MSTQETEVVREIRSDYKYGFSNPDEAKNYFFKSGRGISHEVVEAIAQHKNEPDWMRQFRHKSLDYFLARPLPTWGGDVSGIDFDNIYYYIKPTEKQADSWDDLPADIKDTWDKLGIPEAEKKYLAGVGAQYESEVVYHKLQADLEAKGVLFLDMDSGLREHEELVKQYFGTIIPQNDNKFAALNSAVWSGGSFIYVPPGVSIEMPLQAYFRINAENMGQFERTLIIVDEDAYVHYVGDLLEVDLEERWARRLPRSPRGGKGRRGRQVEGRLRRADPRRGVALRHVSLHPDRRVERGRRPRGHGLQDRRGAALLPHVARPDRGRGLRDDRVRLRRADHEGAPARVRR